VQPVGSQSSGTAIELPAIVAEVLRQILDPLAPAGVYRSFQQTPN